MASPNLLRPALGEVAVLGALYNARTDSFLPKSIFKSHVPDSAITGSSLHQVQTEISGASGLKEKLDMFKIGTELKASILAGLVQPTGSARFLRDKKNTEASIHQSLYYTALFGEEKLNPLSAEVREQIDEEYLKSACPATHVVTEITWGHRAILSANIHLPTLQDINKIGPVLTTAFSAIAEQGAQQADGADIDPDLIDLIKNQGLFLQSDQFDDEVILHEFGSAQKHFASLAGSGIEGQHRGTPPNLRVDSVELSNSTGYVELTDALQHAHIDLEAHVRWSRALEADIPTEYAEEMKERLDQSAMARKELSKLFTSYLGKIRTGEGAPQAIWALIVDFEESDDAPKKVHHLTRKYAKRLNFTDASTQAGAIWVGHSQLTPHLWAGVRSSYVFYFKDEFFEDPNTWKEDSELLFNILHTKQATIPVFIVDCTGTEKLLLRATVSQFSGQRIAVENVLEQRKFLSNKSLIRYDPQLLDRSVDTAPSQRKPVQIPCPGQQCSHNIRSWICAACFNAVEYASVDGFLYCDCGRISGDHVSFNCQRAGHGHDFVSYNSGSLLNVLECLPSAPEVNILILGETGVGKSTFINAFINYLTFNSLDEALDAQHLNWIIPCSFSTQETNETTGQLIQREIKIGTDDDEHDGSKGASATQKATVYPLYMDGKLVRLIDTPGIGDTRGPEYDKENMVHILRVLRNYEKLHGIVILLKPNNARLTVMFRFCVKELLTHLHRNAAENMVFGFTNTRGSNYTPGDTFKPLETLLAEYRDVIPGLFKDTVYCFDSESFRYLAAKKQGIEMGNFEDYRRSWEHSAAESQRLLTYFQSIKQPHEIRNTVSLNETKYLIEQLTSPMIRISVAITDTISRNQKAILDLSSTALQGEALRDMLQIHRTTMEVRNLARPKTVCAHQDCTEIRNSTQHGTVILRKSLCHDPCCLVDVPPNVVGTKLIAGCAAFSGGHCKKCQHTWEDHEHIRIEYVERSETIIDPDVQRALRSNGNEAQAKARQVAALQRLIVEFQEEHAFLQEAAAKFSFYLKQHSITGGGNDATLDYLDHLIRDEKAKVGYGGDRTRLDALERDRTNYINFLKAMEWGKQSGVKYQPLDEAGVRSEADKLYHMPHYGQDLQVAANAVGRAYSATFRERPYRVRGKTWWRNKKTTSFNPMQLLEPTPSKEIRGSRGKQPIRNQLNADGSTMASTEPVPFSSRAKPDAQLDQGLHLLDTDIPLLDMDIPQADPWALNSIPEHICMSDHSLVFTGSGIGGYHSPYDQINSNAGSSSQSRGSQHHFTSNQASGSSKSKSPGSQQSTDQRTPVRAKAAWLKNFKDSTINKLKKKP